MPHWDLFTPRRLCSHAKVTIRSSQSSYTDWNIDSNVLAWNSAPASCPGQAGTLRLPILTLSFIKPLLVHDYLGRSWRCCLQQGQHKQTQTTQTSLWSGQAKFILVHFNNAEGRSDPPGTLTAETCCWLAGRGMEQLFRRSFNVFWILLGDREG